MTALLDACARAGVELQAGRRARFAADAEGVGNQSLQAANGSARTLLVAADGARSKLRELAGIGWVGWGYGQSGIVATLEP